MNPAQRPWPVGFIVPASFGLSVALMTGEWGLGIFLFVILSLLLWSLFTFFPRQFRARAPGHYYALGLAVVVLPFVSLLIGDQWTPWYELQERYGTHAMASDGFEGGRQMVISVPSGPFMVQPFRYKPVTTYFNAAGARFALSFPMSLAYDPLWIPISEIVVCEEWSQDLIYTGLRIGPGGYTIAVRDDEDRVLRWCDENGLVEEP